MQYYVCWHRQNVSARTEDLKSNDLSKLSCRKAFKLYKTKLLRKEFQYNFQNNIEEL